VRRDAAVALLQGLVERPSPTGHVEDARRFLLDQLKGLGFAPEVDAAGNVKAQAGRGPVQVLLCGHLDTVPGGPAVKLEEGVLWGRGAVDAKGCLAAFVVAMHRLRASDALTLTLAAVPDEEGASAGAKHLASTEAPQFLVIGEPSGVDAVTLGYRGSVRLRFAVRGEEQHAGLPTPTPHDRLQAWWEGVRAWVQPYQGASLFHSASAVLLDLATERTPQGQLTARLDASVRMPPGFPVEEFLGFLRTTAAHHGALEVISVEQPYLGERDTPLVRAFVGAIRAQDRRPRLLRKTGTSDLNNLAPRLGVPGLAYGPGDSSLDHTPHERIEVAEFVESIDVLEDALRRLGAGGRGGAVQRLAPADVAVP